MAPIFKVDDAPLGEVDFHIAAMLELSPDRMAEFLDRQDGRLIAPILAMDARDHARAAALPMDVLIDPRSGPALSSGCIDSSPVDDVAAVLLWREAQSSGTS